MPCCNRVETTVGTSVLVDQNCIAVKPFQSVSTKVRQQNGVAVAEQQVQLARAEIVFGSLDGKYRAGDAVYVTGDQCKIDWAKKVYLLDGVEFVLMPIQSIRLVERNPPQAG